MNYIYDITLNLNKNNLYEFYEWKEEDNPEFILKIPVFKIDENAYLDIKNDNIIISKKILELIENKTEVYNPSSIGIIRYASLFSTTQNVIAIEFDSDGNSYMKSNLSIDEENEILEIVKNIKYTLIDYKVKQKIKYIDTFSTREEKEIEKYMNDKLKLMVNNEENSKLKYIFYELYNEKMDDIDKIYNKLIGITKNRNVKFNKLNEILNLMETKKL